MIFKITDKLLCGSRPTDLNDLLKLNVTVIIDLEYGFEDAFTESRYEYQRQCDWPGVKFFYIKCSDIFPPNKYQIAQFLNLIDLYEKEVIFFHCLTGKDRTGDGRAIYRMQRQGWTYERALGEWIALGRHWIYWWWKYQLKKYEVTNEKQTT